ncbi:alpha-amylase family glycosyl hydrolase [Aquipuribacter nitratireducens]|uniref:Alpha-amylase family glycosyl hydrolase n=1 Tax=Aquipuribacter nitratireducens TaxID=650104 RepID=A0ABW0GNT5_9MICO
MTATPPTDRPTSWLQDALLYEIYPQSFADSDGDGVGDLRGVLAHLDHLQWLGVDAIWFNPLFASPFRDAGYDVADYLRVAPRYGTNEDLDAVVAAARDRGIHVLLDLVAGHTSDEHEWFQEALRAEDADPAHDRYIWAPERDEPGEEWVPSPGPRRGWYLKNFYDSQPALNFGYRDPDPTKPWQQPVDAPGPQANRQALKDVMRFWFERGVMGFRVDMAFSLVKDDPGYVATTALWRDLRAWLDAEWPDRVIVPEGVEPREPEPPAFHGDFALVIHAMHSSLFDNGGSGRKPWWEPRPPFFDADARGSLDVFLQEWEEHRAHFGDDRPLLLATADHDYARLRVGDRPTEQLPAAFAFLLTWGTTPSVYYGDEIGQRTLVDAPETEGSVCHPGFYDRAACRTPMQWEPGPGAGFSTADPQRFYLPVDTAADRPDVATQAAEETSLLHTVRRLVALRREVAALRVGPSTRVLHRDYPLVYERGGSHVVVVNPARRGYDVVVPEATGARLLLGDGVSADGDRVHVDGFGWAVLETRS